MDGEVVLPDVLATGLRVVFCGSAAGTSSAKLKAYYAGPGNRFWPLLWSLGLTPRRLAPQDYREVLRYGIGLTDLAKTAFGPDAALARGSDDALGLTRRIELFAPAWLAFNGKRPAESFLGHKVDYGPQQETTSATRVFVLPSTSRANASFREDPWRELAGLLNDR